MKNDNPIEVLPNKLPPNRQEQLLFLFFDGKHTIDHIKESDNKHFIKLFVRL